jgi:hypothetical protein
MQNLPFRIIHLFGINQVLIEAVENHMPQTIVIDEIGTKLEAMAASTIAQRGIQLVATAHGVTIENLIMNPSLEMLVGGIQVRTFCTSFSVWLPKCCLLLFLYVIFTPFGSSHLKCNTSSFVFELSFVTVSCSNRSACLFTIKVF